MVTKAPNTFDRRIKRTGEVIAAPSRPKKEETNSVSLDPATEQRVNERNTLLEVERMMFEMVQILQACVWARVIPSELANRTGDILHDWAVYSLGGDGA